MKKFDNLNFKTTLNIAIKSLLILLYFFTFFSAFIIIDNDECFNFCFADSVNKKYAKAKENCFLFKTTDTTSSVFSNVYFVVPESYFVVILNEINPSVYKVDYCGKIGYVSADSVEKATFIPICPTLDDIYFDIIQNVGTQLRNSPSVLSSNILTIIPAGESNISYISYICGNVPDGGNSDIWYYVKYCPSTDPTSVYEGYVYSEKTCNLSSIVLNKENNPKLETEDNNLNDESISMSPKVRIVLIVLISLPIILVFILLVVNNHKSIDKIKRKDNEKQEDFYQKPKHKVKDFVGKKYIKKSPDEYMFVSNDKKSNSIQPSFPTYEVVDDDDLL